MIARIACVVWLGCAGVGAASEENTYNADRGLRLSATVLAEMGIRVEEVSERTVTVTESETGRVLTGGARPVVLVVTPPNRAGLWAPGAPITVAGLAARVRSNRGGEVVVDVDDVGRRLHAGAFVPVRSAATVLRGVFLPEAAVVDRGSDQFVYVRNETYLKRVAVRIGRRAGGWIAIRDGLFPGDEVAVGDAAALWIAELRAVTGGGRCCPL